METKGKKVREWINELPAHLRDMAFLVLIPEKSECVAINMREAATIGLRHEDGAGYNRNRFIDLLVENSMSKEEIKLQKNKRYDDMCAYLAHLEKQSKDCGKSASEFNKNGEFKYEVHALEIKKAVDGFIIELKKELYETSLKSKLVE